MLHRRTTVSVALVSSALLAVTVLAGPASAGHVRVTGLTESNRLVTVLATEPGVVLNEVKIVGIAGDIVGIDYRPATGGLYAVGNDEGAGTVYLVDTATGVATAVSPAPTLTLVGTDFGVDFNPVPDRLRVVSDAGQNLRINPDTGAVTVDGALAYAATDVNAGAVPGVTGAAYTNSTPGPARPTSTMLFDIDTANGVLALQSPPNAGTLNTRAAVDGLRKDVGFDIRSTPATSTAAGTDTAYVSRRGNGQAELLTINLATGALTSLGDFAKGAPVIDIAVPVGQ